jgi:hypothetical protein
LDEEKTQTEVLRSQTNRQNQEIAQLKQLQREADVQIQSLQTTVTVRKISIRHIRLQIRELDT